jgi:putative hydrolase of the HAD superfamily
MLIKRGTNAGKALKAVLLDLDDTLIIDDALSEQSWKIACQKYAPLIGDINEEKLYDFIKAAGNRYWQDPEQHRRGRLNLYTARREVVRQAFAGLGLKLDKLADELADTYSLEKEKAITLVPGALETLQFLKRTGKSLALLTNGGPETQRRKITRFGLLPYFSVILIEGEFGVGKPDERVFRAALEKLEVGPEEACMVGDDLERDIAGALKSGICGIWVDWRGKGLPFEASTKPDGIIRRFPDLINLLPGVFQ